MSCQNESPLEAQLIGSLKKGRYESIKVPNESVLTQNFKKQLFKLNQKNLQNCMFTDAEFKQILLHLGGRSIFDCAKALRDRFILTREDKSIVYITLFNTKNWDENIFQVTTQTTVTGACRHRYDVTILINGLPLVQIELKRRGMDFKEAFHQIRRYKRDSCTGLYKYIQLFVISNGTDTKYFSNSDRTISYTNAFYWTDTQNNRVTDLLQFSRLFFEKQQLFNMLFYYMVVSEADKTLMVMRPYQIYACRALITQALKTDHNGYIWHTTGSGKTLTAFKAGKILSACPSIQKVFFLVDRKDLDTQTYEEFNKFEAGCIDCTDKTAVLVAQIQDKTKTLIISTIQKMSHAIRSPKYAQSMAPYKKENVLFIIDECHRSQFGQMHRLLRNHFENARFFGFTGTPRFEENKSLDGRATADIFQTCLHTYLIKDAIEDRHVLGFSVEYFNSLSPACGDCAYTESLSTGVCRTTLADKRIASIADKILSIHNRKTYNRKYNAVFTVESIEMLVKYYNYFKTVNHSLKIAGIFTYHINGDVQENAESPRDSLARIMADYNRMFESNYTPDCYEAYACDLSKKVKTVQIDILLVVGMFLTGFDSKMLNTLYVDRNLTHHTLLQAYSRTNRIESNTKPYGNIVCFRNLKEQTDNAIRLFSKTDCTNTVLRGGYDEHLAQFKRCLSQLYAVAPSAQAVENLKGEHEKQAFILAFRALSKSLLCLQSFSAFTFDKAVAGVTLQDFQEYKGKYLKIADERKDGRLPKASVLNDIDFALELLHTDKINVDYIMHLIRGITLTDKSRQKKEVAFILGEIENSAALQLHLKASLLKWFLLSILPTLSASSNIEDAYQAFENREKEKEIARFAQETGFAANRIQAEIARYIFSGHIQRTSIIQSINKGFKEKRQLTDKIVAFIRDHVQKYE